jgi:hypothetical protein
MEDRGTDMLPASLYDRETVSLLTARFHGECLKVLSEKVLWDPVAVEAKWNPVWHLDPSH